jgi:hypothetical protein
VSRVLRIPVPTFKIVTDAFATIAPDASVTVPVIVPVSNCALANREQSNTRPTAAIPCRNPAATDRCSIISCLFSVQRTNLLFSIKDTKMPESARMVTPLFDIGQPFFELLGLKRS